MRKAFVMSAALAAIAVPAGYGQAVLAQSSTSPSVATPAPLPPASQVPAETSVPGPGASAPANQSGGHGPVGGTSSRASAPASNITPADTRSPTAARLPTPRGGENASLDKFLTDAQHAIDARQAGRAQEALERAETAVLQRSVPAGQAETPDRSVQVEHLTAARDALAKHDYATAKKALAAVMVAG